MTYKLFVESNGGLDRVELPSGYRKHYLKRFGTEHIIKKEVFESWFECVLTEEINREMNTEKN